MNSLVMEHPLIDCHYEHEHDLVDVATKATHSKALQRAAMS
jgi:hypothetical protein